MAFKPLLKRSSLQLCQPPPMTPAVVLQINYWAVVVAAVVAFVVGAVWYSPLLFGKTYMELRGMNPAALAITGARASQRSRRSASCR